MDRRRITGYGFRLSKNDTMVLWKSLKLPAVALSTCESEYISLAAAVQQVIFLSQLLENTLDASSNVFNLVTLC